MARGYISITIYESSIMDSSKMDLWMDRANTKSMAK